MDESLLKECKEDYALLIEAGFVAVKQLDETSARRLFTAAEMLKPENTAAQIGLGYIALNKLEVSEATTTFQAVLEQEPENHLAQAFLGICFLLKKATRKKGEKLLEEAKAATEDPTIKNLCEVCEVWVNKDLKKMKAPFFSQEKEKE